VDGNTPLHVAVQKGYAELAQVLIAAGPLIVLHVENGVGDTPLSIAQQQYLLWCTRYRISEDVPDFLELTGNAVPMAPRRFKPTTETEIENLKDTLKQLLSDGRLAQNTKLTTALLAFSETLEAKFRAAKQVPNEIIPKDEKDCKDEVNRALTLQHVRNAASKSSGVRQLVHVLDVQKSVQSDLPTKQENPTSKQDDDGLEAEEDAEQAERRKSLVLSVVSLRAE
jgi:hypothetical protein